MTFDAHVLKVLIASPGDTADERDAVERALHAWNGDRAEREQVILLPRRWETNAVPRLGGSAQSVINEQLVDSADVVLAIFDSRLGMATAEAVSGTAEEIKRADEAGKPVHVWFSEEPIPRDADLGQVEALRQFKATLEPLGLLGAYTSPEDLSFKVRQAIESDVLRLGLGAVRRHAPAEDHAVLRARYDFEREPRSDSRGRVSYRSRRHRITVSNTGSVAAENVHVELRATEGAHAPWLHTEATPTIHPGDSFEWSLTVADQTAAVVQVVMTWEESGEKHERTQDLAL